MVYCGKASLGCLGCRTRRIKCDKLKPECSQCIRVGRKCPGYRDQLSLMFRDESSKVIQKAHAQWGVAEVSSSASSSSFRQQLQTAPRSFSRQPAGLGSSPSSRSPSLSSHSTSTLSPRSGAGTQRSGASPGALVRAPRRSQDIWPFADTAMPRSMGSSIDEQGVSFYINHYVLGHPDDIKTMDWLFHPCLQDGMAAVGLAGLSNLNGDAKMQEMAIRKYVSAIKQTGKLIIRPPQSTEESRNMLRIVVMLAVFELVHGSQLAANSLNTHILGAAAVLRTIVLTQYSPDRGLKGLFEVGYSLLIPCHAAGTNLPASAYEGFSYAIHKLPKSERPVGQLGLICSRFLELSSILKRTVLADGRKSTEAILKRLLDLDQDFENWEAALPSAWEYRTVYNPALPSTAIFRGKYYVYTDLWRARMWDHYRWARILTNEAILELTNRFPESSVLLVSAARGRKCLAVNQMLAESILVSTPSHWCHPHLDGAEMTLVMPSDQAGSGAVGVPVMLHHLGIAACTPGVSTDTFDWAYQLVQSVWGDMGMLHARIMLEMMDNHKAKLAAASSRQLASDRP